MVEALRGMFSPVHPIVFEDNTFRVGSCFLTLTHHSKDDHPRAFFLDYPQVDTSRRQRHSIGMFHGLG